MSSNRHKPSKPIPQHAYSISAGLAITVAGLIARQLSDDPYYQITAIIGATAAFGHGVYSLHQEGRLHKAVRPISNAFTSLWHNNTDNKRRVEPVQQQLPQPTREII